MTAPVATINDHTLGVNGLNAWAQIQNWLSYSDANGDAAVKYQFWDSGAGADSAYFYTPTDTHHAANTTLEVAASQRSVRQEWATSPRSSTTWSIERSARQRLMARPACPAPTTTVVTV